MRLGGILRAPIFARGTGHRFGRQAVEQFLREAADHQLALPVGHAVDPDHEAAGGQPAQVVVALQQHDVGALARGSRCGRSAGRPAAHDQHVAVAVDGDVAAGLVHGAELLARRLGVALEDVGLQDAFVGAGDGFHAGVRGRVCGCGGGTLPPMSAASALAIASNWGAITWRR
jgi:hypothetical protein